MYRILSYTAPIFALMGAMFVAWNPLVLLETSVNGHNDIAMMLVVLLAVLAMATGRTGAGPVLLVVAALVKYSSLVLLPLFVACGLYRRATRREQAVYVAVTGLRSLAVALIGYAPSGTACAPSTL